MKGLRSMTKVYVAKGKHTDLLKLPEYFAEQAKRGKFVTQITSLWFIFEVREPAEMEYNLIPINNHDEFEQIQQLEGWQYITNGSEVAPCMRSGYAFGEAELYACYVCAALFACCRRFGIFSACNLSVLVFGALAEHLCDCSFSAAAVVCVF